MGLSLPPDLRAKLEAEPEPENEFARAKELPRIAFLGINPADLQQATGVRANPLPQTYGELGKQLKSGASEAKEFYKDASDKVSKDFHLGFPWNSVRERLGIPAHWLLPLMIKGDTKPEEQRED